MDHNKIVPFYFKKGSKGVQNSEILHIGKVYRIVLSKFSAVSFLELIVMRAYGNMTTYFFNLFGVRDKLYRKWRTSAEFRNLNFPFYYLILMLFELPLNQYRK